MCAPIKLKFPFCKGKPFLVLFHWRLVDQSSIKLCLIVHLVAVWTLIYFKLTHICMFGSFVHCHTKAKTQRANLSHLTPRSSQFRPDLGDSPPIKMTPSRGVWLTRRTRVVSQRSVRISLAMHQWCYHYFCHNKFTCCKMTSRLCY